MKKRLHYVWLLALCPMLAIGQDLQRYEYWVDEDYSQHTTVNSSSGDITLSMDVSSQSIGVHYLNFRAQNTNGDWGSITRLLYYVPASSPSATSLSCYEYWLDDNTASRQKVSSSSGAIVLNIDVNQLPIGVHCLSFRAQNSDGEWGSLKRMIFYIPDAPDDAQGSPLVGYQYNFNAVATYVSIGEQTSYELKDYVITIPELVEVGNLVTGCTFSFDTQASTAHLERTQLVTFALQFHKKNGSVSAPAATSFTMSDALTRQAKNLTIQDAVTYDKVPMGDFTVFRIDATEQLDAHLNATQQCSVWLYDSNGTRVNSYQRISADAAVSLNLSAGTYFGIVYDMAKNEQNADNQLTLSLTANNVEKPVNNSDDLQDFINGLGDNKGSEEEPVEIPIGDNGLTVNKDVPIDDLQLFINGGDASVAKTPIYFAGGTLNLRTPHSFLCGRNVRLCNSQSQAPEATRAASASGGISNSGKLVFEESLFESGSYLVENLTGGTLQLKANTTVNENSGSLIVNSGNTYIDGTVAIGSLQNKRGGRIYITSTLTKDVNISIAEASDVEAGTAIVLGGDGYTLTEADASHIHLSLPNGYEGAYDASKAGLVVNLTNGIANVSTTQPTIISTYDATGRKADAKTKGLRIQRMSDGTVRKVNNK